MRNLVLIALSLFAFAAAAQGDQVSAYVAGVAALEAEDYTEAARWFEEALDEQPGFADAHYGLARVYAAESPMHDERKVSRELERALRIHPDNARYLEAQLAALRRRMPEYLTTTRRGMRAAAVRQYWRHSPAEFTIMPSTGPSTTCCIRTKRKISGWWVSWEDTSFDATIQAT